VRRSGSVAKGGPPKKGRGSGTGPWPTRRGDGGEGGSEAAAAAAVCPPPAVDCGTFRGGGVAVVPASGAHQL